MKIKYKKTISMLLMLVLLTMTMGSVVASENGDIWIHTYGHGSFLKAAHWTSPNGIEFKDNAWLLAFVAYYQISFFDSNGKEISYVKDHMTSGSKDRCVVIPVNAVKMNIHVSSLVFPKDCAYGLNIYNLNASSGAMAFDGTTTGHNFHLKTLNYDSNYINMGRVGKDGRY